MSGIGVGARVRITCAPPGASFACMRGRVGVVAHASASGALWVVAVRRRESERGPDLKRRQAASAENEFEFVPCAITSLRLEAVGSEAEDDSGVPVWSCARRIRRRPAEAEPPPQPTAMHALLRAKRIAIVVPFRDAHTEQKRAAHLRRFVPHVTQLLRRSGCADFRVLVVEQEVDGRKFNRGKLLNIGYCLGCAEDCDAFIFHDVDLLASDELASAYGALPEEGAPIHIARVWERYSDNPDYFGGIASWHALDFERINGFPSNYWGWGGEDDEMMRRCKTVFGEGFRMASPESGGIEDLEGMGLHQKLAFLKSHPQWKCNVRWELRDEHYATWQSNGLRHADGAPFPFAVRATEDIGDNARKITVSCELNGDWADAHANEPPPGAD